MSPKHRGARRAILLYSLAPTGIEARMGFNLNCRRRTAAFWSWFTRQRRAENPVIAFALFACFVVCASGLFCCAEAWLKKCLTKSQVAIQSTQEKRFQK